MTADAPSVAAAGFPKRYKLRKPAEFKHVALGGSRLSRSAIAATFKFNEGPSARLGLAIAKKSVPHATDRNRIKRLIREDFRCHRQQLPAVDLVFHARPGLGTLANADVRAVLAQLRTVLIDRCARASSPARSAPIS